MVKQPWLATTWLVIFTLASPTWCKAETPHQLTAATVSERSTVRLKPLRIVRVFVVASKMLLEEPLTLQATLTMLCLCLLSVVLISLSVSALPPTATGKKNTSLKWFIRTWRKISNTHVFLFTVSTEISRRSSRKLLLLLHYYKNLGHGLVVVTTLFSDVSSSLCSSRF